jgi:hypothetical protein
MSYDLRNGKLVRQEKLKRPKPVREPITTPFKHELFRPGPVRDMAKAIARQQFIKELRSKGRDPRDVSAGEMENGIIILLRNAGEYYLNKAKEALR